MSITADPDYVCARCAVAGKTCCSLGGGVLPEADGGSGASLAKPAGPESEAECFPVSAAERQRIEAALAGLDQQTGPGRAGAADAPVPADAAKLFISNPNSRSFIDSMLGLFPGREELLHALYPAGESHLSMKLDAEGNCPLLSGRGCILPPEARPWFCRIFPFWAIRGNLRCFGPEECLAVRESRNMRQLLLAFGLDQSAVLDLHEKLRRDWGIF